MKAGVPDMWTGLALMTLAGAYYAAALAIPESLLSDEVGASGLPKLLALGLGLSGAVLAIRSRGPSGLRVRLAMAPQALGLLAAMAGYIVLLPLAGYPLTLAALVAGVALLGGAKPGLALAAVSIAAGAGFWLVFARLFGIAMPAGLFAGGL